MRLKLCQAENIAAMQIAARGSPDTFVIQIQPYITATIEPYSFLQVTCDKMSGCTYSGSEEEIL